MHAAVIAQRDDIELVAVVDADVAAAEALADRCERELGVPRPRVYGSLAAALHAESVTFVVVTVPSGLHATLAFEAMDAGAHVLIEKPLDVSLPRARAIVRAAEAARSRGQVVSVISQYRFSAASEIIDTAIRANRLGRLTLASASIPYWRSQRYYDSGEWRGTWQLDGGGALLNQGVHAVDLLLSFLGKPTTVTGVTRILAHENIEVEDTAAAVVTFESGALATIQATTAGFPGLDLRVQVQGDAGSAVVADDRLEYFRVAEPGETDDADLMFGLGQGSDRAQAELAAYALAHPAVLDSTADSASETASDTAHGRQYDDVLTAIRTGASPRVGVAEAALALATVNAVYVSSILGKTVSIDEVLRGDYDTVQFVTPPTD